MYYILLEDGTAVETLDHEVKLFDCEEHAKAFMEIFYFHRPELKYKIVPVY